MEEPHEHHRALGVADQQDAAAVVVVGEVVGESRPDALSMTVESIWPELSASIVACGYVGAKTLHTCEKGAACATATPTSSGSIDRSALTVFWRLVVG